MPRHFGDAGFSKSELPATEELFNRKCRRSEKSLGHAQKRYNLCSKCELPSYETLPSNQERIRRKKNLPYQHCPSCHCQLEIDKQFYEKCSKENPYMKSMDAMLEKYENCYLTDPQNSPIKRSKSPFSLPSGMHFRPPVHHNCKRDQYFEQKQLLKTEYCDELNAMLEEMMNSGLTDKNTEIFDKNTYRKVPHNEDEQLQCNQEESELDSDCSKRTSTDDCHLKKDRVGCFEKSRESIEECEIERDEELKQANLDCQELNQLTLEVKEYEKMKGARQNFSEKGEQRQAKYKKEEDIQKKKTKFNKAPISRYDEHSSERNNFTKTGAHQRHKIEPSTSYHSLSKDDKDLDNDDEERDFSKRAQVQQESKSNVSSKISQRSTQHQNSQGKKSEKNSVEIMSVTNENEFKCKEEALTEGRKSLYAGGDLDLHACKSYVVDLIDRALSKQLGTQPGDKKVDKNSSSWQEMCFELTRALQGDYCQSFAQNLYNFQENMDNVKLLKRFRWAYVKHIQEQLRSLEKIIDICSPRLTKKESATS